jgi:hypothetical protein
VEIHNVAGTLEIVRSLEINRRPRSDSTQNNEKLGMKTVAPCAAHAIDAFNFLAAE